MRYKKRSVTYLLGYWLACLALTNMTGCGKPKLEEESAVNPPPRVFQDLSKLTNPDVPAGARQILKGHHIKWDHLQVSRDRSRLLVDFQSPNNESGEIITGAGLFDWKAEKQTDKLQWRVRERVELSPDNGRLAIITRTGPYDVRVCALITGEVLWSTGASTHPYLAAGFSEDGKRLATVSKKFSSLEFKQWDSESGELLRSVAGKFETIGKIDLQQPDTDLLPKTQVSGDATRVAAWSTGNAPVRIYDTETGEQLHSLDAGIVSSVAFSPDRGRIATGGQHDDDLQLCFWDATTGERRYAVSAIADNLGFSPDGKRLWTAGDLSRESVGRRQASTRDAMLKRSPDLAVPLDDSFMTQPSPFEVSVWDCSTGERTHRLETGLYPDGFVAFLSDHELLTAGNPTMVPSYEWPMRVYVWNLNSDELRKKPDEDKQETLE